MKSEIGKLRASGFYLFFEDIRTKEQKSFSAIEICASLVKLRDNV